MSDRFSEKSGRRVFPCVFNPDKLCEFRKSEKFYLMDRCFDCVEYKSFSHKLDSEEERFFKEPRRSIGDSVNINSFPQSALNRTLSNRSILTNAYWWMPVDSKGHEEFSPCGRGVRTSPDCARFVGWDGCTDLEAHKGVVYKGEDWSDCASVRARHWWCHSPKCSVCFNRGWSVREAFRMTARLDAGVKRGYGKVEHIMGSFSVEDCNLPEAVLRERCRRAFLVRGVVGGGMIFHGYRIDRKRKVLVWSVHYHCLGFIKGGFDRCRNCKHTKDDCLKCDGFKGQEMREFKKDGVLVKVQDARKTVVGTCWYQLNHCTIRVGMRKFHAITWFGCLGNRKFKSAVSGSSHSCPICQGEMHRVFVEDGIGVAKDIADPSYKSLYRVKMFAEDGHRNVVDVFDAGDSYGE